MSTTFFLPFKGLVGAKTRWTLQSQERQALLHELLEHNLSTVAKVVGPASTVLVCPDRALFDRFPTYASWACSGLGLNSDLEEARRALEPQGPLAVLLPDLPDLSVSDVEAMMAATARAQVALCPDRSRVGTNGLILSSGVGLPFLFEGASFERHLEAAKSRGYSVEVVAREGLAYDADFVSEFPHHRLPTKDLSR